MYLAHLHTILVENFSNNSYYTTAQSIQPIINAAVQADPNKFFTYAQYQNNLTTDVGTGMNSVPGITNLMNGRNTYLSSLADFTNTKPSITNVAPSVINPVLNSTIFITANVVNTNTNSVYLGYRYYITDKFTKIVMYDDGAHGDGTAGDNIYGASVNVNNTFIQYYIYAENNNVGMFSPVRAEHEFYTVNAIINTITAGDLVVNELMAQNSATVTDQDGEYDDWIELYNNTSNILSLDNLYMSDTYSNLLKWQFPIGTTIAPNSYLIVWADEDLAQAGLHAGFKLSASGENVILSYDNGTKIEEISFGVQTTDMGYSRIPNGTGAFVIKNPTFNINNETAVDVNDESVLPTEFSLSQNYPNPFNPSTNIQYAVSSAQFVQLKIYDLLGREVATLVNEEKPAGYYNVQFSINDMQLGSGIYFYKLQIGNPSASSGQGFVETKKMILLK
jgi:hypothetical protein